MRPMALLLASLLLLTFAPAALAGQDDDPSPDAGAGEPHGQGVDGGFYVSGGKAVKFYDFSRLNHALAPAGVDPFTGANDDWNFELVFTAREAGLFCLAGGFYDQQTGGSPVDAELRGFDILVRWGPSIVDNRVVQIFPTMGIGYAAHTVELDGRLGLLGWDNLPNNGTAKIDKQGMLLEAGLRVDIYSAYPKDAKAALLSVQSVSMGWQGLPVSSEWERGGNEIKEAPDDMIHALFLRLNLGLGVAIRQ